MAKATHQGTCQICGSLQKLPKGKLSLHGYNVTYGFFNGICRGARELPFEQSCDLIKDAIERAKTALADVQEDQRTLRTKPETPKAWVHHYVGFQGKGRSSYRWMQVEITMTEKPFSDGKGSYKVFTYEAESTKRPGEMETKKVCEYRHDLNDANDAALDLNKKRADWLEHQVSSLTRYIGWQQDRVNTWRPAELIPVDAKTKTAGFVPDEPKY